MLSQNSTTIPVEALRMRLQKPPGKFLVWEIATEAMNDASVLDALFQLMGEGDASLCWRAAWIVEKVSATCPSMLVGRRREIRDWVLSAGIADSFRRLLLGTLYHLPDEDALDVELLNFLLDRMVDLQSSSAVQALSVKLASRMSRIDADLHDEFLCILRNICLEYYPSGVRAAVRNCLKEKIQDR